MLDRKNIIVDEGVMEMGANGRLFKLKQLIDLKFIDYLRLTAAKNQFNRVTTYHYLGVAVTNSTEPVNGLDYIHNVVAPSVDYATGVGTKSLMNNGRIAFNFTPADELDTIPAKQATDLVDYFVNDQNNSFEILQNWIQDANLNKNGALLILPIRKEQVFYREVVGTPDELRAFEIKASEQGLEAKRISRKKIDVDIGAALQAVMGASQDPQGHQAQEVQMDASLGLPPESEAQQSLENADINVELQEELSNNTIYRTKYKLTGTDFKIAYRNIRQHYFVCNPTIQKIADQDFVAFYDIVSVHDAGRLYPFIDLESFKKHAEYGPNGSFQAGSLENDLAIHVRDSTPVQGQSTVASGTTDPYSRQCTITTAWVRYDWDDDGKDELIEMTFSGSYVIWVKEVEFIPLANLCPKPLVGNFYGYGIGERVVPYHEYLTSLARCELAFGYQSSTPRIGINPEFLDFDEMENGKASLFILDSKFDPNKHVWEPAPLQGNLNYLASTFERMEQNKSAMVGMTSSQDVFNPEVMSPGNSAAKLSLALGPNQLNQENYVRNIAVGAKEMLYLTWKLLLQYADDYGVKRIVERITPKDQWIPDERDGTPRAVFFDAKAVEQFDLVDRQMIDIELALGLRSEENRILREQMITQTQQGFMQVLQVAMQSGMYAPEVFSKIRKPYEDTLYALGVKDCEAYLISQEEADKAFQAKQSSPPDPKTQLDMAKVQETQAKTAKLQAEVTGTGFEQKMDTLSLLQGKLSSVNIN